MTTKQIHETHIKIAFFAMLLIMLAAIYVAIPDFYSTVWQLSTSGNMQGTIDYLRSFGVWAVLVSMIIDIFINIVGFLPSHFHGQWRPFWRCRWDCRFLGSRNNRRHHQLFLHADFVPQQGQEGH